MPLDVRIISGSESNRDRTYNKALSDYKVAGHFPGKHCIPGMPLDVRIISGSESNRDRTYNKALSDYKVAFQSAREIVFNKLDATLKKFYFRHAFSASCFRISDDFSIAIFI